MGPDKDFLGTLQERFWKNVEKRGPDECWEWKAAKRKGYGVIKAHSPRRQLAAHRVSYEFAYGPIPKNLHILHKCDNPACVNPNHLEIGTHAKNLSDASERNLLDRGENRYNHKLTESQVREIRQLYSTGNYFQRDLAIMFGVGSKNISSIVRRKTWAWLD